MTFTATHQIINHIITKYGMKSYLEIGVQKSHTFNSVNCRFKIGVDPEPMARATFVGSSDEFFDFIATKLITRCGVFKGLGDTIKFDLIFIDGLHHYDQVKKDFENAMRCLNPGGFILIHDTNPPNEEVTVVPRNGLRGKWCGDTYKILNWLPSGVDYKTIDYDGNGLTICRERIGGHGGEPAQDEIDYKYFNEHRQELTQLASNEQLIQWISNPIL